MYRRHRPHPEKEWTTEMNFCGTNLRKPTQEEIDKIQYWMLNNPKQPNETEEEYIMRFCNENSRFKDLKWSPN